MSAKATPDEAPAALAVEAFEHLMWADDRADMPMTFCVRLMFAGRLDRPLFTVAAETALTRHPILRSCLQGSADAPTAELRWVVDAKARLPIHWDSDAVPLPSWSKAALMLERENGIRIFVRDGAAETVVTVQVHHAVTDAIGVVRFVEDALTLYNDPSAVLAPVESSRLADRGLFHLSKGERRSRLWRDLQRIALFFRQFPQPLARARPASARGRAEFPATAVLALSSQELKALKAGGRNAQATVNDVLLRDLFLTVDKWNAEHGGRQPIRLAMPINMRRLGDERMPVANVVSMCFIDRGGSALDDGAALLTGITQETHFIKTHYMGHALIVVANFLGRFRGGLRLLMTPRRPWHCSATAVLSNLGDPLATSRLPRTDDGRVTARGVSMTRLELIPPVRPNTALAVGVVAYAGEVFMSFHYDPAVLSAADASHLRDNFSEAVHRSMREPSEHRSELSHLIEKHAARSAGTMALRGLPIGKNVLAQAPHLQGSV